MQMNYREPDTGRPDPSAGASAGQAVWENELPWQLAPLGETGEAGPASAATAGSLSSDGTGPRAERADPPTTPTPAFAPVPVPATTGVRAPRPEPDASAAPRRRRHRGRGAQSPSVGPDVQTEGRATSRVKLAKPVLAGAGVLSALLLVAPALFGEHSPSHSVKAGAEDPSGGYAPEKQYPDTGSSAYPQPEGSGTAKSNDSGADRAHRIAEVAATLPTHETRLVKPMSEPHASATSAPAETPHASSTPQNHWTTTVVNGNSVLEPGQSWVTNRIILAFQGDGNLVLYDKKGTPLWWSGTVGQGAMAAFQGDGNLVVYTQDGRVAWASKTMGHDGAQLVLEAGGNVTIRSGGAVLWSTGTTM